MAQWPESISLLQIHLHFPPSYIKRERNGGREGKRKGERKFNICIVVNFIQYKTGRLYNPYLPVDHKAPTVASGPALQLFGRHRFHDDGREALAVRPSDGSNPFQSAVAAGIGDNVLLFQERVSESSTQRMVHGQHISCKFTKTEPPMASSSNPIQAGSYPTHCF